MTPDRFEALSPRQRECLRRVRQLKAAGEIATELGISASTVNGYLAEAVRILGARNRRDAALALARYEEAAPQLRTGAETRVAEDPPRDETSASQDEVAPSMPAESGWPLRLPIRRRGQVDNPLSVMERLVWVPGTAIAVAIGFGMLMAGLQVAAALIEKVAGPLR